MVRAINILIPIEGDIRAPGFNVTFRQGQQEITWLLTREEGARLAIELSAALIGQAVSR